MNSIYNPNELALALRQLREHIRKQEEAMARLEQLMSLCPLQ